MTRRFGYLAAIAALLGGTAMADADDPPSRVARLNYLSGPVSFRPGSVDDWAPATLNYPLTTGDHLWTDPGAQTEFHIGSTAVRMNSGTAISILNLDDQIAQISLTEGTLNVVVRYLGENESIEVDTPNVAVSLLRPGNYRIQADGDDSVSIVTVRGGEAEVTGGGAAFPVRAGQSARIAGMDTVSQEINPAPGPDPFDRWCMDRERREAGAISARYVPREMVGYEDLDQYGVWTEVPPYGPVWRPRMVVAGWAPYHYGHWAWVEPWGWTWIDDAPWGFAPFHYGRWAFAGGGWFWVPGRVVVGVRPVYAPALVAFVGGGGFSVGVRLGGGVGMAAWFPLGPGEVYRPAYHVSDAYVRNVNIVHVSNVTVINNWNVTNVRYANQGVAGAVTVVPNEAFIHARPVASVAVVVPREEIVRARVVGTTAVVAPVRESVVVRSGGGMVVHEPPARFAERQVVVRHAPPPPPVSFAAKEQALRTNGGRPLDTAQEAGFRQSSPARAPMVRPVNPQGQTFGNRPAPQGGQPGVFQPRNANPPANQAPRNDQFRNTNPPGNAMPPRNDRPSPVRPMQSEPAPQQQTVTPRTETPRPETPRTETPARTMQQQPRGAEGTRNPEPKSERTPPGKGAKKGDRTTEKTERKDK
ncbi:MAG: hypothetical protein P4L56_31605 [Candidatus Sulfopaludibacter sp.]|nr:hypothetical protein [Candidatus Sulfopaludibacter sp.]